MPRRSTGGVVVDARRKSPVFALRFRAYGQRQYVTLGAADEGMTMEKAEDALRHVLADVERGIYRPPEREAAPAPEQPKDPTFHQFASEWFGANAGKWRPKTRVDYEWQLRLHLLPFFAQHRLSQITVREVERYIAAKVKEGVLSATSINKTVIRLAQILERAKRYEMIPTNPAKNAERLKASKPAPVWIDRAEHIAALLDAAGELDARARRDRRHVQRRAMLATLVYAGPRIGELIDLCWRDVDLAAGRIAIRESKTDAGIREVDILPVLRDELLALKASARRELKPSDRVFPTSNGTRHGESNIRRRVLAPAIELANEHLAAAGEVPLREHLTPHKLRHTYASLLVALGVDPGSVMDQLGHTDPTFTFRVYRHGMRRDAASKAALRRLVGLSDQAATVGSNLVSADFTGSSRGSRG
jgi:integrase